MSACVYLRSVAFTLVCSSCASTSWFKDGATEAQVRIDLGRCEDDARGRGEFRSEAAGRAEARRSVARCMETSGYTRRAP